MLWWGRRARVRTWPLPSDLMEICMRSLGPQHSKGLHTLNNSAKGEPGRCGFCGVLFPFDRQEGEYLVTCPSRWVRPLPCDLAGVPQRWMP